jgi:site-specific recombinase XerD
LLLRQLGRSPTTCRMYLAAASAWLAAGGRPDRLDPDLLTQRLGARRRVGASASTINNDLKALRAFYRCMGIAGIAPLGLDRQLPRGRRVPQRLPRWLSADQVGALLAQPDVRSFTGLRDHTLLRVLYETGLRSGELAALGCGDVLPDRSVYVAGASARRDRYAPISAELAALLETYLAHRSARRPGKQAALWISQHGHALRNARSVWEIVARHARAALGTAAGYERLRLTARRTPWSGHYPHLLRAGFAVAMLGRGCNLLAVAQLLGVRPEQAVLYQAADLAPLRAAIAVHPRFEKR